MNFTNNFSKAFAELFENVKFDFNVDDDNFGVSLNADGYKLSTNINNDDVIVSVELSSDEMDNNEVQNVVNALLSNASTYIMENEFKSVIARLKINDEILEFVNNDSDVISFRTKLLDGREGTFVSDDPYYTPIKTFYFLEDGVSPEDNKPVVYFNCETNEECGTVDSTHVYTDDELKTYTTPMCNVVCESDAHNECDVIEPCCGCVCEECDGCDNLPWDDEVCDTTEYNVPETVNDCDFAGYIKNVVCRERYINPDEMMNNLRTSFIEGNYEVENGKVIIPLEDLIKRDSYIEDVNLVKSVLDNEVCDLEKFLKSATKRFGFVSASYELDKFFGCIDLKFELPE